MSQGERKKGREIPGRSSTHGRAMIGLNFLRMKKGSTVVWAPVFGNLVLVGSVGSLVAVGEFRFEFLKASAGLIEKPIGNLHLVIENTNVKGNDGRILYFFLDPILTA